MDFEKNIDRLEQMLIYTCGCTYEQASEICRKAEKIFRKKAADRILKK
jgi:hypothetical protein